VQAVEELQKEVWRLPGLDVVPLSHLVAVKSAGGVDLERAVRQAQRKRAVVQAKAEGSEYNL